MSTALVRLTDREAETAAKLWRSRYDTHDIARIMSVPEAAVYNSLPRIRGMVGRAA